MTYDWKVYEAQRYLWVLHRNGEPIPPVLPDGYFGHSTTEAVEAYQQLAGLPVTGRIDYPTWTALYQSYQFAAGSCARSGGIFPFEKKLEGGVLSPGDRSDTVYLLQVMLQTISPFYADMIPPEIDGEYGRITEEDVALFQRKNGLPDTGEVDKYTWNRLASAYNRYLDRE